MDHHWLIVLVCVQHLGSAVTVGRQGPVHLRVVVVEAWDPEAMDTRVRLLLVPVVLPLSAAFPWA